MKRKRFNLVINAILIIICILLSIFNSYIYYVVHFTSSVFLNLLIFCGMILTQLFCIYISVNYYVNVTVRDFMETKEMDRVRNSYSSPNKTPTKIYQLTICDALKSVINSRKEELVKLFNSEAVSTIFATTDRNDAEESSQLFVNNSMVVLQSYRTYPRLNINYGTDDRIKEFSIVLDNSGVSNFADSSLIGIPIDFICAIYQIVCDLTRTDVLIKDLISDEIVISCRPETEVYLDYGKYLTKNLILGGDPVVQVQA